MPLQWLASFSRDARNWQITALSGLFLMALSLSDFGTSIWALSAAFAGAITAQLAGTRLTGARFEWKSALITSLSLSILLRATDPVFWFLAGLVAIGTKFAIRYNRKHVFNPACIGIVTVVLLFPSAWISPGQWGQAPWFIAFATGFAALVLSSAKRLDIALGFLAVFAAMLFGRALWLGDPMVIPMHQMQSGALLVFAFFMITDPRSTPDSRAGRLIFAASVALLAAWLSWGPHVRGSMLYALAILAPLTPILDRLIPAGRFQWTPKEGHSHETETSDDGQRHLAGATGA